MIEELTWSDSGARPEPGRSSPGPAMAARTLGPVGEALEFRILGPVEVRRGGVCLRLGGRRPLAVVTQLVLDVGRVVSTDRLTDGLWGDAPPAAARATLQSYISRLRNALDAGRPGGAESLVAGRHGGYVLAVDPEAVDACRFEQLAARGREALAAGRADRAAGLFEEALALWRGPALSDFAGEPFAAAEVTRLEELRLSAVEDQTDAALALGRHRAVVAELERMVAAHPFRERLRGQLMVALYRSGRQPEALRLFQGGRRLLREELGIEPGSAIKALEAAILRQDPALDWTPSGGRTGLAPSGPTTPAVVSTGPAGAGGNTGFGLAAGVPLAVAVLLGTDPLTAILAARGIVPADHLPEWVLVILPVAREADAGWAEGAA